MTDSWRLKLYRAEEHLSDLGQILGVPIPEERRPYPCREVFKTDDESDYVMDLGIEVSERFVIVAGELLFNVRSALDHLICALIPSEDKGLAQFPISTVEERDVSVAIEAIVAAPEGCHLNVDAVREGQSP